MKKIALKLLTGLVILFCNQQVKACDYMMYISTSCTNGSYPPPILYLDESETTSIYALYGQGLINYFMDELVTLVWDKDGVPFKTTNIYDTYTCQQINSWAFVTRVDISEPGTYSVTYSTPNGQPMNGGKIVVMGSRPIEEITTGLPSEQAAVSTDNTVNIYPNPTSDGYVYIEYQGIRGIQSIELMNENGQQISNVTLSDNGLVVLNTGDYKKGLYFIRINMGAETIMKKIIIN